MTRTTTRLFALAGLAIASALAGMWLAGRTGPAEPPPELERALMFPAARSLPDFSLVDDRGQAFGPAELVGGWTVLFFGFTHCPDICPATLATLAAARRKLGDLGERELPRVVLVSVDPSRDTPEKLAGYVSFFDPGFRGVTGSEAQIAQLTEGLGVAVFKGAPDAQGNYTVDHTASLFLVNPAGAVAAVFGTPHEPAVIARDYRRILAATPGSGA